MYICDYPDGVLVLGAMLWAFRRPAEVCDVIIKEAELATQAISRLS